MILAEYISPKKTAESVQKFSFYRFLGLFQTCFLEFLEAVHFFQISNQNLFRTNHAYCA